MATKNRIGYTIEFNVDKAGLSEVTKQLNVIKQKADEMSKLGGVDEELKKASKDAETLKDILTRSWNSKLNQLDINKVDNELKKCGLTANQLKANFTAIGPAGVAAFNQFASSILNANMQLKQSSKLLDDMAVTFKNTIRYGISSSIFNNLSNSIQKAFNYTKALDTSLNDIRIVTGYSADEMEKFAVSANKVSKELGKSTKDFTEASLIYYQQGLGAEEAQARAEVTLKAANVTGQTGREVSEQLTAVWNGYKVTAEEAELYVDKLAAVAAGTAADLEELSTGMSKVASAASLMGVDIDQLNAQLATIVSATRQAPESVGVALKTIYARMSDIQSGLDDETTLGNYTEKMAKYGINVLDANNKLRDMGEVIEEIGNKWETLSREQQVALTRVMAGTRQYNNLLSLFDNWDKYQEALEMSANAAGTLQRQQDIYMESTEAHLQQLRTEAERTYDILFNQDTINGFSDALTNMLSIFNNFLEGIGGGGNAIAFFGATVANVFNKQIGAAIERQIENIETIKANKNAIQVKEELSASILTEHQAKGESVGSGALEAEAEMAQKILSVKQSLSNEEYNELTAIQQKLGLDTQRLENLKNYHTVSENYFRQQEASERLFKTRIADEEKAIEYETIQYKRLQNLVSFNRENQELSERQVQDLANMAQIRAHELDDEKQQEIIAEAILKIRENERITEEEAAAILKANDQLYAKQAMTVNELKSGLEGLKLAQQGYTSAQLESITAAEKAAIEERVAQKERQQTISQGVKGLSSMVSVTISLIGLFKTLDDDSLSATEKFERILPTLLIMGPQVITFFKSMSSIIPMLAIEFKALGDSIAASASEMLGFEVAAAPVLITLTAIVAVFAVLGVAAYNYAKKQDEANDNLERATQEAKKATEALNETKEAYENLEASIEKYKNAESALNKLTEGTVAWKKQVIELNNIILELLDKYPQLAQFVSQNKQGIMSISSEGYEELLKDQLKKLELAQMYQSQASINRLNAQKRVDTQNLKKTLGNEIFTKMSDADIQKLARVVSANQETINKGSNQDIINLLEKNGIDLAKYNGEINANMIYAADSLVENNHALVEYNNQLGTYTDQIGIYTESIVTTAASGNVKYEASPYKALINPTLTKSYEQAYEEELERLKTISFKDIAATYKSIYGAEKDNIYGTKNYWDIIKGATVSPKADEKGFYMAESRKETSSKNWITTEKAKERIAQDYAKRYTQEVATPSTDTVTNYINSIQKQTKNKNLGEAFNAYKSGQDLNTLYSEKQLKDIQKSFESLDEESQKRMGELFGENFSEGFTSTVQETLKNFDPAVYAQSMEENFNKKVTSTAEDMKKKYELDEQDFIDYATQLSDIAADKVYDVGNKLADSMENNAEVTSIVAKSVMRMNKGIDELAKNWEDWSSILKKSSASSEEYSKALNGTRDALSDLLDIEEDAQKYFTNDFIQKHLKEIEKAAKGDAKAIDNLRNEFAKDVIVQIYAENKINTKNISDKVKSSIENINKEIPDIQVGYQINPDDKSYAKFLENCQNIINSAQMTEEQANAYFASMGFEAEYEQEPQKLISQRPVVETITEAKEPVKIPYQTVDEKGNPKTDYIEGPRSVQTSRTIGYTNDETIEMATSMGVKTSDGKGRAPKIKSLTKKGTGNMNNYSSSNKGGTSSPGGKKSSGGKKGKSGGSSKDPDKMEKIKNEEDRYHQVDIQLKLIENDLTKIGKAKDKAFGTDKIALLNKELEKYDRQIKLINDKRKIAEKEADELRKKISKQGVKFNTDGTVSNYVKAIQAQEDAVNKMITKYNKMSAKQQEKYKDTVEKAKENFEEFKKNIDRYDELISSTIPELQQATQDAIDAQVDIQIEKFDMEIEIRLDLTEARKDWTKFRKEVLRDFNNKAYKSSSPIADMFEGYTNLENFFKSGLIENTKRQLEGILKELQIIDNGGTSGVYGQDRVKAMEDAQKYLSESMSILEEMESLEEQLHQSFVQNIDDIQDHLDEQWQEYETISKLLDHDKEVIELVSGDEAYKQLSNFYNEQEKNYAKQLQFQAKEVDFWKNRMEAVKDLPEEFKAAKEQWENAVENYNDLIESSIENLQNKYLNTIKEIFEDLNNRLSGGRSLEGMNEQWQLLNMQSEEYLDNVNGIYRTQELANKYLDAIDNTSNIKAQQRLKDIMDDELANLRAKDQLSEYDLQRAELRYQIAIKQIALEEAQQNKSKMRLRRDTQGNYRYEYVADDDQLNKTKQELSDFYNQLYNLDAKKYSENLEKVYNLTKDAEDKIQKLYEDTTLTNEERQAKTLEITQYYAELIDQLTADNEYIKQNLQESTMSELFDLYDINKDNYAEMTAEQQDILEKYLLDSENLTNAAYDNLFNIYNENIENFKNMTNEEINTLMNELIPGWDSAYQHMIDSLKAEGGFVDSTKQAYAECETAAEEYYNKVMDLANKSKTANEEALKTVESHKKAEEELFEAMKKQWEDGQEYLTFLEALKIAKEKEKKATEEQTVALQEYLDKMKLVNAEDIKEGNKASNNTSNTTNSTNTNTAASTTTTTTTSTKTTSKKTTKQGNGKLEVGDKATYTGKYYANSKGTGGSGSKYSGVKNGIIVDKINNNSYGVHIKSADGKYKDLGWVKKSQLSGYDTGGYTGVWGNDGRLALLHQKELVLNSTDTMNMLNAVKIIRQITDSLGSNILNRLADINAAGISNFTTGSNTLAQKVDIQANFPNVQNHNEIEEALNNLVNAAAHRVNSNLR